MAPLGRRKLLLNHGLNQTAVSKIKSRLIDEVTPRQRRRCLICKSELGREANRQRPASGVQGDDGFYHDRPSALYMPTSPFGRSVASVNLKQPSMHRTNAADNHRSVGSDRADGSSWEGACLEEPSARFGDMSSDETAATEFNDSVGQSVGAMGAVIGPPEDPEVARGHGGARLSLSLLCRPNRPSPRRQGAVAALQMCREIFTQGRSSSNGLSTRKENLTILDLQHFNPLLPWAIRHSEIVA
ncbi:hypothetical protein THAOC_10691 [Thalassiosira oceanica]|uniref:Uncharacterized protein n=1 Tax=Thalassiosira oceanica TaxID=159749 RepID=K0SRZ1_THAOC|nr:hypothetical protein THAOC_10691 [Thalassiosira oceanica]|eukprot:EJK68155.1 hypothetical protein THAOC_10691 [Thalassiosira oceanica]